MMDDIFYFDPNQIATSGVLRFREQLPNDLINNVSNDVIDESIAQDLLLNKLDEMLETKSLIVVRGMRGTCKRKLVSKYAHEKASTNQAIVRWIDARSKDKFDRYVRKNLAADLRIANASSADNTVDDLLKSIVECLRTFECQIIFVLHNLANYSDLGSFVDQMSTAYHIKTIITTKNACIADMFRQNLVELVPIDQEMCSNYLKRTLGSDLNSKRFSEAIACKNGYALLSSLIQLISLIKEDDTLLEESNFKELRKKLSARKTRNRLVVHLNSNRSWHLLQFIAHLRLDGFFRSILAEIEMFQSNEILTASIEFLKSQSLIIDEKQSTLKIHPIVQSTVLDCIASTTATTNKSREILLELYRILSQLTPCLNENTLQLQKNSIDFRLTGNLYLNLDHVLKSFKPEIFYNLVYKSEDSRRTLEMNYEKLFLFYKFGESNFKSALFQLKRIRVIVESESFATAAPTTTAPVPAPAKVADQEQQKLKLAKCYHRMGDMYDELNELNLSRKYVELGFKLREEFYRGQVHSDLISSANNTAIAYEKLNKFTKSKKYNKQAIQMLERLPDDDPKIVSQSNYKEEMLSILYNNLGQIYQKTGNLSGEEHYKLKCLEIMERTYGDDQINEKLATSYNNIGIFYSKKGDFVREEYFYNKALNIYSKVYNGAPNADLALIYNNLGVLDQNLGKYTSAAENYKTASEMIESLPNGANNAKLVTYLTNLSQIYEKQGKYKKALEEAEQAKGLLDAMTRLNGSEETEEVAEFNSNYGLVLCRNEQIEDGLKLINKSLEIRQRLNHSNVHRSHFNLGLAYGISGNYEEEVNYILNFILNDGQVKSNLNLFDVLEYNYCLGESYKKLGNILKEIEYKTRSVNIIKGLTGYKHPFLYKYLNEISEAYGKLDDHEMSLRVAQEAEKFKINNNVDPQELFNNRYVKKNVGISRMSLLGTGGCGVIYLVKDIQDSNRPKVLKEIMLNRSNLSANEKEILKTITVRYSHDNIIRFYDSFTSGLNSYLVLEYCENGSWADDLKQAESQNLPLKPKQLLNLLKQLASAIAHLHNFQPYKIVHRDIKPHNVLLKDTKQTLKLIDFGLSVICTENSARMIEDVGTPGYKAPEIDGKTVYNESVDIWAFGALTQKIIQRASSSAFIIQKLQDVCEKCQSEMPDDRPTSSQLQEMLKEI